MDNDTAIGGTSDKFPLTRISAIHAIREGDEIARLRAFDLLIAAYWKPVYKYIRIKWHKSNEDAKDLTQGFFAKALEKNFFSSFDPGKSKFRTFLLVCLEGYLQNEGKSGNRIKRGGDMQILSLDFQSADEEMLETSSIDIQSPDTIERYFDIEWMRSLFALSIDELKSQYESSGKAMQFRLFERYDLERDKENEPLSYGDLAKESGIAVTDVTNYLSGTRREFRSIVLNKLRELTATEEEYRKEVLELLGIEPK